MTRRRQALIAVLAAATLLSLGYLAGGRYSQHNPGLLKLGMLLMLAALTALPVIPLAGRPLEDLAIAWLRKAGFEPVYFSYKSLLQGPDSARVRLRQVALERPDTHILAHSLGGLVTLNALAGEQSFNGRIICVG